LTSAWSAASSDLYTSSRALVSFLSAATPISLAHLKFRSFLFLLIRWTCCSRKCPQNFHEDVPQWSPIRCHWYLFTVWPAVFHGNQIWLRPSLWLVCEYDRYSRYHDSSFGCCGLAILIRKTGLVTWFGISVTYIRFHKGFKAQGYDRSNLPYASALQPFAAWYAAIACFIICFVCVPLLSL
jgi:hypothetical protein